MHMTDENKQMFFDHMGHSEAMSKDNYQCPAGVKEINIMGKMLGHQGFSKSRLTKFDWLSYNSLDNSMACRLCHQQHCEGCGS